MWRQFLSRHRFCYFYASLLTDMFLYDNIMYCKSLCSWYLSVSKIKTVSVPPLTVQGWTTVVVSCYALQNFLLHPAVCLSVHMWPDHNDMICTIFVSMERLILVREFNHVLMERLIVVLHFMADISCNSRQEQLINWIDPALF